MIKVENLTKVYDKDICAIEDISFELPQKGMVCITGESGSGKSTLLNCLYGAEDYDGKIYIDNKLVTKRNIEIIRKQYISMVYQDFGLIEDMTVEANIRFAFESVGEKFSDESLTEILQKLGLKQRYKKSKCKELSGGEKQRVAIARALAQKSSIILADEPTGSLDSKNSKAIFELLKKLSADMLVVIVTHNEKLANEYSDYQITLCDGKVEKTNLTKEESLKHEQNLVKRESSLSLKSFFDIFKWSFNSKIIVVLLSVFSVILLLASMTLATIASVNRNDVVVKNMKYKDEHTISFEIHYANQIDKEIFANYQDVCYGYQLNQGLSFNGVFQDKYDDKNQIFIFSQIPNIQGVIECEDISKIGGEILYGRDPQSPYEIAINHYVAKWMISNNQLYNGEVKTKEQDLLGLKISGLEIVGIIDSKLNEKINLAKLDKVDYTKSEVSSMDDKEKIVELQSLISNDFDSKILTTGYGFAKENGISNNCYYAYLSSKTKGISTILNSFEEESYVILESRYTYGMYKAISFFEKNQSLFLFLTIAVTLCAVLFVSASSYILLKEAAGNILILRSIGLDKRKIFYPLTISQILIVFLQLLIGMCGTLIIITAINSKIASTLIVPFTTLFANWSFIGIISVVTIFVIFVFIAMYLLNVFSKTINYHKRKN